MDKIYHSPASKGNPIVFTKTYPGDLHLTFSVTHLSLEQAKFVEEKYESYSFYPGEYKPSLREWFQSHFELSLGDSDEMVSIVAENMRNPEHTAVQIKEAEKVFLEKGIQVQIMQQL